MDIFQVDLMKTQVNEPNFRDRLSPVPNSRHSFRIVTSRLKEAFYWVVLRRKA